MKECTTPNNHKTASVRSTFIWILRENHYRLLAGALVLGIWWGMSRIYSPLIVPPIDAVVQKIYEILSSSKLWKEIGNTVIRLLWGLGIGMALGCLTGLCGGLWRPFREVWKPILGIIQVVPPISWLILAIIWLGYNGKASVFIVVTAVTPSMFICVSDGIAAIDRKLTEMGTVFQFSFWKKLRYIFLPSIMPHFFSGLKIAIGVACKTVVMGEVLTTTSGIGGQIMTARLNIEPETVIAWTVIIVGIYYLTIWLGGLCSRIGRRVFHVRYTQSQETV